MNPLEPIPLSALQEAQERIADAVPRTPLVALNVEDAPGRIHLKLENLQPIGSFKLRGATNAIARADADALEAGVWTASAGNMAQGLAWSARRRGVPCRVLVPDHAPRAKLEAIERLGASWEAVPFEVWWRALVTHEHPGFEGLFVHPVSHPDVVAGNGTIGLEILEDLPEVETIIVPFGGGGLSTGIATAARALQPDVRVLAAEVETAAPLAASFEAERPVEIDYTPSFVDGIGGRGVLEEMWPLVSELLDGSLVVSLEEIADAVRLLAMRNHVVAEGAGAASVAAALSGVAGEGDVVCVVSGGNIDAAVLARILAGETP